MLSENYSYHYDSQINWKYEIFDLSALAALAGSQLRTSNQSRNQPATNQQSHEMTVPNELIGCIIGKVTPFYIYWTQIAWRLGQQLVS